MNSSLLTLDFFRKNDLSYYLCFIHYNNSYAISIPFTYNDYYNFTLEIFMNELNKLENSKVIPIAYNPVLLQIFTNFFACFEQFVSIMHIILYYYKSNKILDEKESIKKFRQNYGETISIIFNLIGIEKTNFYQLGIINKIKELEDARNYILHGNLGRIKVMKTKLPESSLTINYEDIMEELDIIINFINFFRYVIPKIDLMPQVKILIGGTVLYKPLDEYFYNLICPYLSLILKKHHIAPSKEYALFSKPIDSVSSNIVQKVEITIKAKPDDFFHHFSMGNSITSYYPMMLMNFLDKNEINTLIKNKTFRLAKFMLN